MRAYADKSVALSNDMSFTIRAATAADLPFLWEMLYEALYVLPGQPPFPREILQQPEIRQYLQDWGRPDDFGWLAEAAAQPIGAAWIRLLKDGYGYIQQETPELTIAVKPAYRGCGVGSSLLTALFAHAQQHYPALSLSVSADNPAVRLYQRLGFVTLQQTGTSLVMRKLL
jgi:ribosomal protein S18 acetylase RimI-like enzyme